MNYEAWIWTELLAFDNTAPDQGVGAYLERLGFVPEGISLLASASDFIMLHEPLDEERPLFPDVCARFGHAGNEERERQDWTNYQLRDLVANLKARGIAVFVSIFLAYHHDRFHQEWLSDHPEARVVYDHLGITDGVEVLARLADGTYYQDHFAAQLARVITDYGFDGWHGPDGQGPAGSIGHSDCSDGMIAQFAVYLGDACPPGLELITDHEVPRLQQRMDFIWSHLYREWIEFNLWRWEQFWATIVATLRPLGAKSMINSANTKSAFEAMFHNGMDYRRIARLGVDYLVVETVAANLAIINGEHERHFDFAATLAEMKALVPEMKLLFLHGVKDVTESYDLLRHAPGRLERECFTLANQTMRLPNGELERCASGFLVCLGDGLAATEWAYLRQQWQLSYSFKPTRSGGLTWLWSEAAVDRLLDDYPRHGTWPAFRQVGHLAEMHGLQLSNICRTENLQAATGPLLVTNADLLTLAERAALARYDRGPVALLGRVLGDAVEGEGTAKVTCRVSDDYVMGCVVIGGGQPASEVTIAAAQGPEEVSFRPPLAFWDRPYFMALPDEFWTAATEIIQRAVAAWEAEHGVARCVALNPEAGLRLLTLEGAAGILRTALVSCVPTYLCPEYRFEPQPVSVQKRSGFPYTPLTVADGVIHCGDNTSPLHVPPYGIVVMDVGF